MAKNRTAESVVDVILGEAKGANFYDMLAVASAIQNRSQMLGVDPQAVVSRTSEFNAFGKPIPAGNNAFRDMAELAWDYVTTVAPIHNGTFYATPTAQHNLPSGLQPVLRTDGHIYFVDPQARPINVAGGTAHIKKQAAQPLPLTGPIPAKRPDNLGVPVPTNIQPADSLGIVSDPQASPVDIPNSARSLADQYYSYGLGKEKGLLGNQTPPFSHRNNISIPIPTPRPDYQGIVETPSTLPKQTDPIGDFLREGSLVPGGLTTGVSRHLYT